MLCRVVMAVALIVTVGCRDSRREVDESRMGPPADQRERSADEAVRHVDAASRREPEVCVVTWRGYDGHDQLDLEKAEYLIGGTSAGFGNAGFERVVAHLQTLQSGAHVIIYPEPGVTDWLNHTIVAQGGASEKVVTPFMRVPGQCDTLDRLSEERDIFIWLYLWRPKGFDRRYPGVTTISREDIYGSRKDKLLRGVHNRRP